MTRVLFKSVVAAMVVALTGTAARADILIDDFSLPSPAASFAIAPGPNPTVITTSIGGGTTRTATFTVSSPSSPGPNALAGRVGDGVMVAAFDPFTSGSVNIAYSFDSAVNFIPNVPAGGSVGELLFSGFGDSGFAANIPLTLTIATATGDLTYNGTLPLTQTLDTTTVPLSGLSGTGDLSQVTGLTIDMSGGTAADLVFDSIGVTTPDVPAVPAPPAAVLALAAVPALGLLRAVRRKA